jgi:F-box/TPR repeat protein Pof3
VYFPNLKRLDLSVTDVDGCAVKEIVTKLGSQLEYLCVNDCFMLGRDAVDWARAQGVKVDFRDRPGKKGAKVRYWD